MLREISIPIDLRKEVVVVEANVLNSLNRYFNVLEITGSLKQSDVDKLLVYKFISELLNSEVSSFITEGDYSFIDKALNCLYGSTCLIPYPEITGYDNGIELNTIQGSIVNGNCARIIQDSNLGYKHIS